MCDIKEENWTNHSDCWKDNIASPFNVSGEMLFAKSSKAECMCAPNLLVALLRSAD